MGLETRPLKRGLLTDRQMGHLTEPIGEDSEGDREGDPGHKQTKVTNKDRYEFLMMYRCK